MAFGLVPHYSVVFPVEGLTPELFLEVAEEAARKLEWNVSSKNPAGFIAYSPFRKRSINEKISVQVENDLVTLKSESTGGQFIDWGRNKRNVGDFMLAYDNLKFSLTPEEIRARSASIPPDQPAIEAEAADGAPTLESGQKTKGILSLFLPVRGYFITPILIDLNILIFVVMVLSGVNIMRPDNESLLWWGANFRPYTLDGQSWRLLTNFFLHIGILHLLFNMYALVFIGVLLEPRLGSWRLGIAYLVTGIIASVASVYWHPVTISAGASGAIFGLYGVFLAMLTTNLIEKSQRKALLVSIILFVGYNLANGLKGGIDNAAHLGGLISGFLIGYSFYPGLTRKNDKRLNYGLPALAILALLGFSSWKYKNISNDIVQYEEKMKSFSSMEYEAMKVFRMRSSTPKDRLLSEIKDRGLYYWQEDKNLVTALDKLDLPAALHERNAKLIRYCDLRIASFALIYKAVNEGSSQYADQIKDYTQSIDSLIKALK